MTVVLVALAPTAVGLALSAIADAKRRRLAGEPEAPSWLRPAATILCVCGGLVALSAGGATLVLWVAAAVPLGWLAAVAVSAAPAGLAAWIDGAGPGALRGAVLWWATATAATPRATSRHVAVLARSSLRHLPTTCAAAGAAACVAACWFSWQASSAGLAATRGLFLLQARSYLQQRAPSHRRARACMAALVHDPAGPSHLRAILSDHAFIVQAVRVGEKGLPDGDWSRCTAPRDHDVQASAGVEVDDRIDAEVAAGIHHALSDALADFDAALALDDVVGDARGGGQAAALLPGDVAGFVCMLGRDAAYAKVRDLLGRLPHLGKMATAVERGCRS